MKLYIMKRDALETLKANLPAVYGKYYTEKSNKWIYDICGEDPFIEFKDVTEFTLASLNSDLTPGEIDLENCKILYEKLMFLSESQASDERLWAGLTHLYYVPAYAPQGVVCLMSAASYYNLTTYRPDSIDVAIQRKSKISTMPDWPALSVYYYADDRFEIGVETVQEGKNQFKIYDIEKTVVDIVFFREKIGIEETKGILVNYLRRKDRNLNRLLRYAEMLKCGEIMKTYLEVLV